MLALLAAVSLRQRQWNRADGYKQKEAKCTPKQIRLNVGINLFFHLSFGVWRVGLWKSSSFAPPMDVVSGLIWGETAIMIDGFV